MKWIGYAICSCLCSFNFLPRAYTVFATETSNLNKTSQVIRHIPMSVVTKNYPSVLIRAHLAVTFKCARKRGDVLPLPPRVRHSTKPFTESNKQSSNRQWNWKIYTGIGCAVWIKCRRWVCLTALMNRVVHWNLTYDRISERWSRYVEFLRAKAAVQISQ